MSEALERLDALLTRQGREVLAYLAGQKITTDNALRIGTLLRARYPADLVASALAQQELRLRATEKFTKSDRMFFTREGLAQSSAEPLSQHRARRFAEYRRVADLCTGIGGDLIALAENHSVLAVDADPVHLRMAELNAEVYQVADGIHFWQGNAEDVDLFGVEAVFVDPARRAGSQRMRVGDSSPTLDWCFHQVKQVSAIGIKAAPGIDRGIIPAGWELECVSYQRNLREAVIWSPELATTTRRATILPGNHILLADSGPAVDCRPPGDFLFDPNPAVTRAELVTELARKLNAWQIDKQIAFLSSNTEVHTPFARTLRVLHSAPWHQKKFAEYLRKLDIGTLDIRRRGLAGDIEALRRGLKLRGSQRAVLAITRVDNSPWGIICVEQSRSNDKLTFR